MRRNDGLIGGLWGRSGMNLAIRFSSWGEVLMKTHNEFRRLLDRELLNAARHRHYISVILVRPSEKVDMGRLLEEFSRGTDDIAEIGGAIAVLMTQTDREHACRAVDRCKQYCDGVEDLHHTVVVYPEDAGTASGLLAVGRQRLEQDLSTTAFVLQSSALGKCQQQPKRRKQ